MHRSWFSAALLTSLLIACGDDGASKADATTNDTTASDTTESDTAIGDTAVADTAVADTADTTPVADTLVADTTPVDLGEGTCGGILSCVRGCAAGSGDPETCTAACAAAADSQAEGTAFGAVIACFEAKSCDPGDGGVTATRAFLECQRQCLPELATCFAGSFAAATCVNVATCINNDCFGDDILCRRACFATGTQDAVQYYIDYDFCAGSQCYDPEDPVGEENCIQQAASDLTCLPSYTQCFGSTGGSAGPSAGGGE